MIYPDNFEVKLGFDRIRSILFQKCLCSLGEEEVNMLGFSDDYHQICRWCGHTTEMAAIIALNKGFPDNNYYNMMPELVRLKTPGTFSEPSVILELSASLDTILNCKSIFNSKEGKEFPLLSELSLNFEIDSCLQKKASGIIDDEGEVKDSASEDLAGIRKKLKSLINKADRRLIQILKQAKTDNLIPEDWEATIRNGRLVLPVPAVHKRRIKGFIHDESATGQTVFIEPAEIFEINNEIRDLENDERKEIIKILVSFADFLRPFIDELLKAYMFLGKVDFIRAKALLALSMDAVMPVITNKPYVNWKNARHSLLVLSFKDQKKKVVPADILLDENNRILVISGPNAGGKSVCMKTAGLNQYMLQCGLLIPVSPDSEAGIFKNIFIEIGDDQSLENDLSTYSSHLKNISFFLKKADSETLFLIDELGAGTEPQLGGAIAEAALEELNEKRAFGVVTTHYTNIKLLADTSPGIFNGAMLFNSEELRPMYILKTGRPGSSFAFEIAAKTGFPDTVLNNAASKNINKHLDFDKQLNEIDSQKEMLVHKQQELDIADQFLNEIIEKYTKLNNELDGRKNAIIKEAHNEALSIINNSNSLIEKVIREIRESIADSEKIREVKVLMENERRKHFSDDNETMLFEKQEQPQKSGKRNIVKKNLPVIIDKVPEKGDMIMLKGQDWIGELIEITGKMAVVTSGIVKLKVPVNEIKVVEVKRTDFTAKQKSGSNFISDSINDKAAKFKTQIDIRGMRVTEALEILRSYIDDVLLLHIREVAILHGKGDGVLRRAVRDYLSGIPEVTGMKDQLLELGGSGITVVEFK